MPVKRPRNRLVYCRVSEDEFEQFNQMCGVVGARSVSDLLRAAIRRMINNTAAANRQHFEGSEALEQALFELNCKLQQLTILLETRPPNP